MKIKLTNFQLFKSSEVSFSKINAITGINYDNLTTSSNGSGKSTIAKNAVLFGLYGEAIGLSLKDLISDGEKETEIVLELNYKGKQFKIIRRIPSSLQVFEDEKEIEKSTNQLKQQYLNNIFGDYQYFKKYRLIDLKGINLLDSLNDPRGITTLKKELMFFIDDVFDSIRKSLLAKKLERETYNVNKRLYTFSLSEKRLKILEEGRIKIGKDKLEANEDYIEQGNQVNLIKSKIQTNNNLIFNRIREIENAQKSGLCPILHKKCLEITKVLTNEQKDKINKEIKQWNKEILELKEQLITEEDALKYYRNNLDCIDVKRQIIDNYIMKLKEAFKFASYKYTEQDVLLYSEAIKTLDNFSGFYIYEWLGQLSLIVNDLLKNINLKVEFIPEKEFMIVYDAGKKKNYNQLSSGQKTFLSAIFKLAILIHRGENSGIILADEGLSDLDENNLNNFIEVCKDLNFQINLVYQDIPFIEGINIINIERKDGNSLIKED